MVTAINGAPQYNLRLQFSTVGSDAHTFTIRVVTGVAQSSERKG